MINILLKILLWLALGCCFALLAIVCADYFDWHNWQQLLFFISLIVATLLIQWGWRRWKLARYLNSLSVSKTVHFDANKALKEGLIAFKRDQQLTEHALAKKPWSIGIAFSDNTGISSTQGVLLANNQANVGIRLLQLDTLFLLQFEFNSKLLLERELDIYQLYLLALEKNFKKAINGFFYLLNAYAFEQYDALNLANLSENIQKIGLKTQLALQKNYPFGVILQNINQLPGYQDFIVRVPRKTKSMPLGWQASTFEFYSTEDWFNRKQKLLEQWLVRIEYCFATNLSVRNVDSYQVLTHIQQQLDNIQIVFDAVSEVMDIALVEIYWVESISKLPIRKFIAFTDNVFNKQLVTKLQPQWTPTIKSTRSSRATTLLAIYLCVIMTAFLYSCYSYSHVKKIMLAQINSFPKKIYFNNDLQQDLTTIGVYKTIIDQLDGDINNNDLSFKLFRTGFNQLQTNYVRTYSDYFTRFILKKVDGQLNQIIHSTAFQTDPILRGEIIFHIMNRLNLLDAKLHHKPLDGLAGPNLWLENHTQFNDSPHYLFSDLYLTYLANNKNEQLLQEEYNNLKNTATQLNLEQDDFHWLPDYINSKATIAPIKLNTLWGGTRAIALDNSTIEPSDTFEGSQAIIAFWKNFKLAFFSANTVQKETDFLAWYQVTRYTHWSLFLTAFPQGYLTLLNIGEWNQVYIKMASGEGVSQSFLALITQQFSDQLTQSSSLTVSEPAWLVLTNKVTTVLNYGLSHNKLSTVKEHFVNLKALIEFAKEKKHSSSPEELAEAFYFNSFDEKSLAANEFYQYTQALSKLYVPVMLTEAAYQLSKAIYTGSNGQFIDTVTIEKSMEQQFNTVNLDNVIFWNIYRVPLEFYLRYINYLSANYLNQVWQNEVLVKLQNSPEFFMSDLMFGESGVFWTFYNKYITDYFNVNVGQVIPKFYFNIAYPFTDDFYQLLVSASSRYSMLKQQDLYKKYFSSGNASDSKPALTALPPPPSVDSSEALQATSVNPVATITALPPTLNKEAILQPQQITLLAECTKGNFELTNYNFPMVKALPMPLSDCGKLSLRLYFGEFYLEKNYPGATGFLDFLTSINNNSLTFTAKDFPNNAASLKQYHINSLILNYQLSGLSSMLEQYQAYMKTQKNLSDQQKNYTSIMDLPSTIVYTNALDRTFLKNTLSDTVSLK